MYEEKQQLRREIARQKKLYSSEQLQAWSDQLMSLLEQTELFRQAHAVACYHALPGEVQTAAFLNRWYQKKRLALPVVQGMIYCSCLILVRSRYKRVLLVLSSRL